MGDTPYRGPGSTGPIIIHTQERLVRIPADCIDDEPGAHEVSTTHAYNATPADLERAGWVEEHLLVTARAEMRELGSERDEARDTIARARGCITDVPAGVRNALDIEVARLLRERDEARAALATMTRQRDDALQVLGQAREALPSDMRGGWLVDAVRRLVRERDEARAALAAMTRQHDDATALASRLRCDLDRATDREDGVAAERARIVAIVREDARRLRLSWPTIADAMLALADRLERGVHAGTPVPAAEPRATDEELADAYNEAFHAHAGDVSASRLAAVAAVAARVRREQCLVTRAVEAGLHLAVRPYTFDRWTVIASHEEHGHEERVAPAADVPATLARLLGEVARG